MEWLQPLILWIIAAIALIYFGLGLFNVEWHLRVRILAALVVGGLVLAAPAWSLVRPADPLGPVSMFTGEISTVDAVILIVLGFAAGALATLACYPLGSALGPFAAPAGTAILALSSGPMRNLLLYNQSVQERSALYAFLRWELVLWLAVCGAGVAAVILTSRLLRTKMTVSGQTKRPPNISTKLINGVIGAVASAFVVYLLINIFAQGISNQVPPADGQLNTLLGLAGKGQIAFGVFVSVGLAAFLIKYFVKADYLWAVLGAAALYFFMYGKIVDSEVMKYLVSKWPIDFLSHAIYGITPLQFASFAFLGALTGFWIAVHGQQKAASEGK